MAPKRKSKTLKEQLVAVMPTVPQVAPVLSNSNLENVLDRVIEKYSLVGLKEAIDLRETAFSEMELVSEIMRDPRFAERMEIQKKVALLESKVSAFVEDTMHLVKEKNPGYQAVKLASEVLKDHSLLKAYEDEVRAELRSLKSSEFEELEKAQNDLEDLRKTLDPMKLEADKYAAQARAHFAKAQEIAQAINPNFRFPEPKKGVPAKA